MKQKLIVALDVNDLEPVKRLVGSLSDHVGMFKIGKQLFIHAGPSVVKFIQEGGGEVFLDLKFHDIPNTVSKAAVEATRLGVKMFNLHASGGLDMMCQTVEAVQEICNKEKLRRPILLGVTVLTSLAQEDLARVGITAKVADQVVRLATLCQKAGMDGVVASPREVGLIRSSCGPGFTIVCPGIRPQGKDQGDQKRVMTPGEAIRAGADYIVVGRPILEAKDPPLAAREVVSEMEAATNVRHGGTDH
ncbi:MAG TPA: orotidine-5'-phosphate decarboxylase [Candidatus Binatia bacterium]